MFPAVLAFIVLTAFITGLYSVIYARNKSKRAIFESIAQEYLLDLKAEGGWLKKKTNYLSGEIRNQQVKIFETPSARSKNRQYFTRIEIHNSKISSDFAFGPKKVFNRIGEDVAWREIEIGHPALDQNFSFKSDHPDQFSKVFTPNLIEELNLISNAFKGKFIVENGLIQYTHFLELNLEKDKQEILLPLDFILKLLES